MHIPHHSFEIPSVWKGKRTDPARGRRRLPENTGYFAHVTSRAVHQQFLFQACEKEMFVSLLRRWADFSGITVLTHCMMTNHFHLFLWIPPKEEIADQELIRRLGRVWPREKVDQWADQYSSSSVGEQKRMKATLMKRMYSLPAFMRILKQTYSVWYNKHHDVLGTLWEGRYRCMVVHPKPDALLRVAAYIDLNPVRAGICNTPEKYSWCGFSVAIDGDPEAQMGLCFLVQQVNRYTHPHLQMDETFISWQETRAFYAKWIRSVAEKAPG